MFSSLLSVHWKSPTEVIDAAPFGDNLPCADGFTHAPDSDDSSR